MLSRTFKKEEIGFLKKIIFDFFSEPIFGTPKNLKAYFQALFAQTLKKVHKTTFSNQAKIILVT